MLKLSILSLNTWHGLDHRNPYLMWPLESLSENRRRRTRLVSNLKHWKISQPALCLIALQEMNPVFRMNRKIRETLAVNGELFRVNHGLKMGLLSYPLFLNEGLASFWSPSVKHLSTSRLNLSGKAWGLRQFASTPFCLQLVECRGALFTLLKISQCTILFINTHLHHELSENGKQRRLQELSMIFKHAQEKFSGVDLTVLAGDLNCEAGGVEFKSIEEEGFTTAATENLLSWDPSRNSYAQKLAAFENQALQNAEKKRLHLDHILIKAGEKLSLKIASTKLEFTDTHTVCSDHFGVSTELEIGF